MLTVNQLNIEMDERYLFENLSFALKPGQVLHLKGPNGIGKTTLLRTIAGLFPSAAGHIELVDNQGATLNMSSIGYIGHKLALEGLLTVEENLHFMSLAEQNQGNVEGALAAIELQAYRHQLTSHLSQGQQKRLSLARFFLLKRTLWLLDEPFTALDNFYQASFKQAIEKFVQANGMVILTSHIALSFKGCEFRELDLTC